jgi:predicted RNA-binding protein with PUA-like domain
MNAWLMKSEPDECSIDDALAAPKRITAWTGVRNYQARNCMRDAMRIGDGVLFYHSSCAEPGIVGIVEIVRAGYPDHTAFDPDNPHYDPKSTSEKPIWYMVDVCLKRDFKSPITLRAMKTCPALKGMQLLARGNRLSVMPVTKREWDNILQLESN